MIKAITVFVITTVLLMAGFTVGWHVAVLEMGMRAQTQQECQPEEGDDEEEYLAPVSTTWRSL
jgi:hypothetical protein